MTDLAVIERPPDAAAALALDVREPTRLSATTLMAAEKCLLAAFLARRDGGDPSGEPAILGQHFHDVAAQVGFQAGLLGRETVTPDQAERTALRVLERPAEHRPLSREHLDELLDLVRRWALTAYFPVRAPHYEVEISTRHQLAGQTLSGRIDLLAVDGATATVDDYKTSMKTPTQEEVAGTRRRDGTQRGGHLQLPTYAWHVLQDHPHVEQFVLTEHYVRSGVPREVVLTRDDVVAHERWLRLTALRLRAAWSSRAFIPTPGAHCRYCPNPHACPLPEASRPESIDTDDQAERQLAATLVEQSRLTRRKRALRAYLKRDDVREGHRVTVGDSRVYLEKSTVRKTDAKLIKAAGLDPEQFKKPSEQTNLVIEGIAK